MTRFLFFYLKTGGGHLAPAKAVSRVIGERYASEATVTLADGLEGGSPFARFSIEDGYRFLQSKARWCYALLYFINKFSLPARLTLFLAGLFLRPGLREIIMRERPDRIVIFHFLLIDPIHDIVKQSGRDIPIVTAVTDPFTAHPLWFRQQAREFILFSDQLGALARGKGLPESHLHLFPFPVSGMFSETMKDGERVETRRRLGIPTHGKVILVFGGADGIPRGAKILRNLIALKDFPIIIVCGRDQRLYQKAMAIKPLAQPGQITVFGFVDFIRDLIGISDVVVSKCGASTFKEILLLGRIPIVTDYIWEQEKGNVEFLQKHRFGFFEPDLEKLSILVRRLLEDKSLHDEITGNIVRAGLRNGASDVARWLVRGEKGAT